MVETSEAGEVFTLKRALIEAFKTKSGMLSAIILAFFIIVSIFAGNIVSYDKALNWNNPKAWEELPRLAMPEWACMIYSKNFPRTIIIDSRNTEDYRVIKVRTPVPGRNSSSVLIEEVFEYEYDDFPSEVSVFFDVKFGDIQPKIEVYWVKPDGSEILLFKGLAKLHNFTLYITKDPKLVEKLYEYVEEVYGHREEYIAPSVVLFAQTGEGMHTPETAKVLKTDVEKYKLRVKADLYGKDDDINVKLIVYGKVHGFAGTDDRRRDIFVAMVWGIPIALSFGVVASVSISLIQALFGAMAAWYGGVVDNVISRLTEIYMIIPFLPILIVISFIYRLTIWMLLLVVVALSLFGGTVLTIRSLVMQIKTESYIEAAISYGASSWRIVLIYIMPRVISVIFPGIVMSVPAYVFLEAALALLNLGDPTFPTLGKVISDSLNGGAVYHGYWWWVLLPSSVIIFIAVAFALLGYTLDKIVNPKLREQ